MPLLLRCGFGVPSPIGFGETRGLGLQEGYPVQAVWANTDSQGNGERHVELALVHEHETSAIQPVILRQPVLPHLRVREG
ncbi:uncharacterized protein EURHEDRAFT_413394 [Aspergillus ruber CBS 135680]|uniref:Uncharacterized protein n=1 Tax=Aspergillus ruber (strain CBS 135680) TaxID=1388766 RepID=A0A017SD73_ASPRC|nr:uncharacterized protein EURHEDRAFT_413394 [Aspergillus ruber CBS 135680]EYE94175.1 hypothetical protein EURHEDRAFT_413394 [Aspergillus ruber CBS 135680]